MKMLDDRDTVETIFPLISLGNAFFIFSPFLVILTPLILILFTLSFCFQIIVEYKWWKHNSLDELLADGDPGDNGLGLFIWHGLDAFEIIMVSLMALLYFQVI